MPGESAGSGGTPCDAIIGTRSLSYGSEAIGVLSIYSLYILYRTPGYEPGPVRGEGRGRWFWTPVCGVSHRHHDQEESGSIV